MTENIQSWRKSSTHPCQNFNAPLSFQLTSRANRWCEEELWTKEISAFSIDNQVLAVFNVLTVAINDPLDNSNCRRIGLWTFLMKSRSDQVPISIYCEKLKTDINRIISIKLIQNHLKYLLFLNIQVKHRLHNIQYKLVSEIKGFLKVS